LPPPDQSVGGDCQRFDQPTITIGECISIIFGARPGINYHRQQAGKCCRYGFRESIRGSSSTLESSFVASSSFPIRGSTIAARATLRSSRSLLWCALRSGYCSLGTALSMSHQQQASTVLPGSAGVRGILVYCSDYRCSHRTRLDADRWPGDVRLSDIEPLFTCQACGQRGANVRSNFHWEEETRRATTKGTASLDA
jgi:hypothetical protein